MPDPYLVPKKESKLSCTACFVIFHPDDKVVMVNGNPYHVHHQPQKANGKLGNLVEVATKGTVQ